MGFKPRMRDWIIWLSNHRDCRDDMPVRVKARTKPEAIEKCGYNPSRFAVEGVYKVNDFHRNYPGWRGLV